MALRSQKRRSKSSRKGNSAGVDISSFEFGIRGKRTKRLHAAWTRWIERYNSVIPADDPVRYDSRYWIASLLGFRAKLPGKNFVGFLGQSIATSALSTVVVDEQGDEQVDVEPSRLAEQGNELEPGGSRFSIDEGLILREGSDTAWKVEQWFLSLHRYERSILLLDLVLEVGCEDDRLQRAITAEKGRRVGLLGRGMRKRRAG